MDTLRLISPTPQPCFCDEQPVYLLVHHKMFCVSGGLLFFPCCCCLGDVCLFVCLFCFVPCADRLTGIETLLGGDADIYQSMVFDHHHAFDELA